MPDQKKPILLIDRLWEYHEMIEELIDLVEGGQSRRVAEGALIAPSLFNDFSHLQHRVLVGSDSEILLAARAFIDRVEQLETMGDPKDA